FNELVFSGGDAEWCWRAQSCGFQIQHQPDAIVRTKPRTSLCDAIRQARRVAGGREMLKKHGLNGQSRKNLLPLRGSLASTLWIFQQREVSVLDRLRVFAVAALIKLATTIEVIR